MKIGSIKQIWTKRMNGILRKIIISWAPVGAKKRRITRLAIDRVKSWVAYVFKIINSSSLNTMIPILVFQCFTGLNVIKVWGTGSELFPSRRSSSSAHWVRQKVRICSEAGSAYYQLEAELELLYFYSAGFTAGFLIGILLGYPASPGDVQTVSCTEWSWDGSLSRIVCLLLWDCLDHILSCNAECVCILSWWLISS